MSRIPYPTPPGRKRITDGTPSPHVLDEATGIITKCEEYGTFSTSVQECRRAFYSTSSGVFAVYFLNIDPESRLALTDTVDTIGHTGHFFITKTQDYSLVVGDDFDLELPNNDAAAILHQAAATSQWFAKKTANTVLLSRISPFPVMHRTPSMTNPEDNALVFDYLTANKIFGHDIGARFVSQSLETIAHKDYRRHVWKSLCDIFGMAFDDLDATPGNMPFLDPLRGLVISPLFLNRIPNHVLTLWSDNKYTSIIFPAYRITFCGFIRPFQRDHPSSQFSDLPQLSAKNIELDLTRYREIPPSGEFMQLYPNTIFTESFRLLDRDTPGRFWYRPLLEIYNNTLVITRVYTRDTIMYRQLLGLTNAQQKLSVDSIIPFANRVNQSLTGFGPVDVTLWTVEEKCTVINHVIGVAYDRVIYGRQLTGTLNRQYRSLTYGELDASALESIINAFNLTDTDAIVDIGCGLGIVGLYLALRLGRAPAGIEIRKDLDEAANQIETIVRHHARRWGLWVPIPRRITADVFDNEEIRVALEQSTVILVNNRAFEPMDNHKINQLVDGLPGRRIVITTEPLLQLTNYEPIQMQTPDGKSKPFISVSASWTANNIPAYGYRSISFSNAC